MSDLEINELAVEVLPKVKTRLGLDNDANDETLTGCICDIVHELLELGISSDIVKSSKSLGVITKGVKDTWNYNDGKYSDDFYNRADRLRRKV